MEKIKASNTKDAPKDSEEMYTKLMKSDIAAEIGGYLLKNGFIDFDVSESQSKRHPDLVEIDIRASVIIVPNEVRKELERIFSPLKHGETVREIDISKLCSILGVFNNQ